MAAVLLVVISIILFGYFIGAGSNNINTDVYIVNKLSITMNAALSKIEQGVNQHQIAFNSKPQQLSDIVPVFISDPALPSFMQLESFQSNFGAGGLYTGVCFGVTASSALELQFIEKMNKNSAIELSNVCSEINTDDKLLSKSVNIKLIYLIRN